MQNDNLTSTNSSDLEPQQETACGNDPQVSALGFGDNSLYLPDAVLRGNGLRALKLLAKIQSPIRRSQPLDY